MATLSGAALKVAENYSQVTGLAFLSDLPRSAKVRAGESTKRDSCRALTISTLVYSELALPNSIGNVSVASVPNPAKEPEGTHVVSFSILYANHTGRSREDAEAELYRTVNNVYTELIH